MHCKAKLALVMRCRAWICFSVTATLLSCGEQAEGARTRLSRSAAQSCHAWVGQGRVGRAARWERRTLLRKPHQLFLHNYFDLLNSFKQSPQQQNEIRQNNT